MDITKKWTEVDKKINQYPVQAQKLIDEIYDYAFKNNLQDDILKCFIYNLKAQQSQEEYFEKEVAKMEKYLTQAPEPNKSLMYSILAELYWQYFNTMRWQIQQRTKVQGGVGNDIQVWTTDDFVSKVIEYYNLSVANEAKLKDIDADYYKQMIYKGTKPKELRPTMYDFLAARAIDFFSKPEASTTRPIDYFQILDDRFFADVVSFVNADFSSSDTLSLHYNGVKILQTWLKFRLKDASNIEGLIAADLKRLEFANNLSVNPNKETLYFEALQNIIKKYPNAKQTGYAKYHVAKYYERQANKYNPEDASTGIFKEYYLKALDEHKKITQQYKDDSELYGMSQNSIYAIEEESLSFKTEEVITPQSPIPFIVYYRNIKEIFVEVRKIGTETYKNYEFEGSDWEKIKPKNYQLIKSYKFQLKGTDDYQPHSTELVLESLPKGVYMICISNKSDFGGKSIVNYQFVQISNLSIVHQTTIGGILHCRVLDRTNSKPIAEATVEGFYEKYDYSKNKYVIKSIGVFKTNENGVVDISPKDDYYRLSFEVKTKDDYLFSNDEAYAYKTNAQNDYSYFSTIIYTDRKLYRPGQTVYFKGLLIEFSNENRKIVPNNGVNVKFYDVNWQEISNSDLKTNEFGTFNGTFTIPTGILNGRMTIYTTYGSVEIQVEEYKRPQFFVEMLPVDKQYLVNDKVTVKGEAQNYSGVKLNDAKVTYKVVRRNIWRGWWWWNVPSKETMIAQGTTITDANGQFEVIFKADPDLQMPKNPGTAFIYSINVDVTDINGETHSTTSTVQVGYTAMILNINIESEISTENISKNKENFSISANNLNYETVNAKGTIEIYSLTDPQLLLKSRKWSKPDIYSYSQEEWYKINPNNEYDNESDFKYWKNNKQVFSSSFDTKNLNQFELSKIKDLKDGVYKIIAKSKDEFGNDVETIQFFVVYSKQSEKMPYTTYFWTHQINPICEPGENAEILIGSSKKVQVHYQLFRGNNLLSEKNIELNNSQNLIQIPIKEENRGGLTAIVMYVVDNKFYTENFQITIPYTNKDLKIEFSSFRDKLLPGQQEIFKLTIKNLKDEAQIAELMATMYDESLDALMPNSWNFSIYPTFYSSLYWTSNNFKDISSINWSNISKNYLSYNTKYYNYLNWFGFYYYYNYYYGDDEYVKRDKKAVGYAVKEESNAPATPVSLDGVATKDNRNGDNDQTGKGGLTTEEQKEEVQIRKNFNETAFFYPTLKSNENGEVVIAFTIPEALTKWRFMGLAHTKDLKYGLFDKSVVTQKQLMVMPNPPRFFRQGDTLYFSTKISNLSEKDLSGMVSIEFFDELTGEKVNILMPNEAASKQFNVGKGLSSSVQWQVYIPFTVKTLTYKIIARADNYSDGEQKMLPVVTNRMLVTESLPLPVRANETKEFRFEKLINSNKSKTLTHEKITVEFTSNPAWLAVQALPYLIEYPWECTEQTFARYYANSLASHVANSSPKIKAVFDTWKNYQPSALMSNLEKNQELKQALLEETPWVLDAKDENERKHRIALLFDLNRMANELNAAFEKIRKEQTVNGGWSWFKGMPESWYITQYLAEGFGHLGKLGVIDLKENKIENVTKKAVEFTDREMNNYYKDLLKYYTKKQLEDYEPSSIVIHYFYTRSFFPNYKLESKYNEASTYFYGQFKKNWFKYSIYNQGMLAIVFFRNGETKLAQDILQSLREKAVYNEELGMYWKENAAGYYWYQAPIETQSLLIEAFYEVGKDNKSCDEMKIWLLKNKQTNDWKTTTATAKAIYALLLTGGVDLLANTQISPVQIGDITIDPQKDKNIQTEAGTGYYKVSYTGSQIKSDMGKIKVQNRNNIVSWGAIYWQYWEDLDKITPHETPLKIKKDLFVEVTTNSGKILQPITENTPIKVGDKVIIRIEIRVDRDMEYVHLKDMRASGFEPLDVISMYRWQDGIGYYQTTKDASTNFFMDVLRKGTYVFQYALRANIAGNFSNGITTIQCMYAPEFTSHSQGIRVNIK